MLAEGAPEPDQAAASLSNLLAARAGAPFRPKMFAFVEALPKTRNQKILRRLVRAALMGTDLGDTGSLVNPETIDAVRNARRVSPARAPTN